ncbi:Proteophosphoglycan 5 [Rhodotorula toruloides ATCC 204091]|uniref:Proteophosphoglycan 5 n=1 Tax=Rhodotorula toruloides TaxID=5286 RepID=A0A0K3CDU3_RHOTO|nr:Proteophosphoglycan 5 [Rhodotorula toruloides ATCC 204091]KAK4334506.1 Proteophosphoglycan 5 [Rhodotorula toruloides]PRQ75285.1 Proteophosphoglycan 5 [Rhodotorula toruloides]
MPPDRMDPTYHPLIDETPLAHRRRKTQPSRLSPLRCCVWSAALLALVCGAGITLFFYNVFKEAYKVAAAPHRVQHANETLLFQGPGIADNESHIIRSFFGAKDKGGVETFDLKAAIWAKVGTEDEEEQDASWTLLYSEDVLKDVEVTAKSLKATQRVTLPRSLLSRLLDSSKSQLQASFAMLPSSSTPVDPLLDFHTFRSSRNATYFSRDPLHPLAPLLPGPVDSKDLLKRFLGNAAVTQPLLRRSTVRKGKGTDGQSAEKKVVQLVTSSIVTMAKDFAVYDLEGFNASLAERNRFRALYCARDASSNPACIRSFSTDGHFENLIEFDNSVGGDLSMAKRQGWRYGPFLTTRYGLAGPKDLMRVKGNETDDLSFDWHITWTAASPLRLAVSSPFSIAFDAVERDKVDVHEEASSQDFVEIIHSAMGHHVRPGSRPLARVAVRAVGAVAGFLQVPIDAHYWLTRSLSTGISLPFELAYITLTASDLARDVIKALIRRPSFFDSVLLPTILFLISTSILLSQVNLLFGLEWQWGGPKGFVPVGLERRRPTHSERASRRADGQLDWRWRVLLVVATAVLLDYGPTLPHILTSSYTPPSDDAAYKLLPRHFLTHDSILFATELLAKLSQAHLSYRLRTFAGTHRISAILVLLHSICDHGPTILTSFFGSWEARPPLYVSDLVAVLPEAVLAWQAVRYPTVKQEEEEEE